MSRKKLSLSFSLKEGFRKETERMRKFTYVRIPADPADGVDERVMTYTKETEDSCMTTALQDYFRQHKGTVSMEEQKSIFAEQLAQNLQEKGQGSSMSQVNEGMLDMLMNMQTVDIVPLFPTISKFDFVGVNMYVDDRGASKRLPINVRATSLAEACGLSTVIRGDAFISRSRDTGREEFDRMDFVISELSSDEKWVRDARSFNLERAAGGGANLSNLVSGNSSGVPRDPNGCDKVGCTKKGSMRCSRCKKAKYCSRECQSSEWSKHKKSCTSSG